ncbi:MAG: DUF1592 domain-containing protein [Armatimonas sp.]
MRLTPLSLSLAATMPLGILVLAQAAPPKKKLVRAAAPPVAATTPKPATVNGALFDKEIRPLYVKYCGGCHSGKTAAGSIDLGSDATFAQALKNRKFWDKAILNVDAGNMPPPNMPQPTPVERKKMIDSFQALLTQVDCQLNDPGRVTMRRLNRAEYNNTVRDLLGVDLRLADAFPSDDVGYGFDNIGDVLSLSPLLMEKYLAAGDKAAKAAIVAPENGVKSTKIAAADMQGAGGSLDGGSARLMGSMGEATYEYDFREPGEYIISVGAWAQQAGPENAKMALRVGTPEQEIFEISAKIGTVQTVKKQVTIPERGKRKIGIDFVNDYYEPNNPDKKLKGDRNLVVEWIDVRPVNGGGGLPASHTKLITARPEENSAAAWDKASKQVLKPFLNRAFRRPTTEAELARFQKITRMALDNHQTFERGIQLAVQGALVSPSFLYRVEADPQPDNPKARRPLTDFELATRLSYFLWSSMPDDRLISLANQGKLKNPETLQAEMKRMLKDPKAKALADNFAGQWLQLRKLSVVQPDTGRFPGFDEALRQAMKAETETFFTYVVQQDRPITEFLDANYTFLNERLAKHYGILGVTGPEVRKVALADGKHGGLLTQASILTLTSNPGRTSPVKRGKWVMENILGTPPPPAPPNVPALDKPDNQVEQKTMTVRQRLEEHRKNPACASCHRQMDNIGFALENFDGVGAWRDKDGFFAIDTKGELADGSKFTDATTLKKVLMGRKAQFTKTFIEKLLTYGIGRGIEPTDHCNIDSMVAEVAQSGYKFSSVVEAIIDSPPFKERRGDETGAAATK